MTGRVLDGDNDEKEPKQCQTHVVWAIHEFLSFFLRVFILTSIL